MKNIKMKGAATYLFIPAIRTVLLFAAGLSVMLLPVYDGKTLEDASRWWMVSATAVNVVTIAFLDFALKREGKSYFGLIKSAFEKKRTPKEILASVILMMVLGVGGMMGISFLMYGSIPSVNMQPLPVWAASVTAVLFPVTIVMAEIPFYLGYCAPKLKSIGMSECFSVIYPLFFYGLQHCFMPVIFDAKYMLSRFLMFAALLVMLGLWYLRRKDIASLMVGHFVIDAVAAVQMLVISIFPALYEMMQMN